MSKLTASKPTGPNPFSTLPLSAAANSRVNPAKGIGGGLSAHRLGHQSIGLNQFTQQLQQATQVLQTAKAASAKPVAPTSASKTTAAKTDATEDTAPTTAQEDDATTTEASADKTSTPILDPALLGLLEGVLPTQTANPIVALGLPGQTALAGQTQNPLLEVQEATQTPDSGMAVAVMTATAIGTTEAVALTQTLDANLQANQTQVQAADGLTTEDTQTEATSFMPVLAASQAVQSSGTTVNEQPVLAQAAQAATTQAPVQNTVLNSLIADSQAALDGEQSVLNKTDAEDLPDPLALDSWAVTSTTELGADGAGVAAMAAGNAGAQSQQSGGFTPGGDNNAALTELAASGVGNVTGGNGAAGQVANTMTGMIDQLQVGRREVAFLLNPEKLGQVRVQLASVGPQQVASRLIVDTPEAMRNLQQDVNQLKQAMARQGIQLDSVTIVMAGGDVAQSQTGGGDQNRQSFAQFNQEQNEDNNRQSPSDFRQSSSQQQQSQALFNAFAEQGQRGPNGGGHRPYATPPVTALGLQGPDVTDGLATASATVHDFGERTVWA
jgi:hypothetical protein